MGKFHIYTQNLQGNALFSGKIYTVGNIFTRPPVVTVVKNFKSGDHRSLALPWSSLFNWFTATETLSNRKAALSVELDGTRALRHNLHSTQAIYCWDNNLHSLSGLITCQCAWLIATTKQVPIVPEGGAKHAFPTTPLLTRTSCRTLGQRLKLP